MVNRTNFGKSSDRNGSPLTGFRHYNFRKEQDGGRRRWGSWLKDDRTRVDGGKSKTLKRVGPGNVSESKHTFWQRYGRTDRLKRNRSSGVESTVKGILWSWKDRTKPHPTHTRIVGHRKRIVVRREVDKQRRWWCSRKSPLSSTVKKWELKKRIINPVIYQFYKHFIYLYVRPLCSVLRNENSK